MEMRKGCLPFFLSLCILLCVLLGAALWAVADAPQLSGVFPDNDTLILGARAVRVEFDAGGPGTLAMSARIRGSGADPLPVREAEVSAGHGAIEWDGRIGGQEVEPGLWELFLTLRGSSGALSPASVAIVEVVGASAAMPVEARPRATPGPDRQLSPFPDPHERCFWNMDIDNLDPENPEDWPVIWEILMQPITVLDADPKAHVYPLNAPDANPKEYNNITGQLHGTTQGVHVLETLPNGWSLIEAYANDGFNAPRRFIRDLNAKLIHGYVRTSQLKTVTPNREIAVLIDKLTQRLYVFQNGVMTGQLRISTGLVTKSQPHSETPAGEFLTDSWVGLFMNGNMYCDMAIRVNGGILIHEVPYVIRDNGNRNYASFEQFLGRKASHGCIRVPRDTNEQGMNMRWLWQNLKRQCKVLIWDDAGRSLPPPDPALPVYYNPDGGKNFHLNQMCPGVKDRFLPLTGLVYADLYTPPYDKLTPCTTCDPPPRHEDAAYYEVPDEIHGVVDEGWEEP